MARKPAKQPIPSKPKLGPKVTAHLRRAKAKRKAR